MSSISIVFVECVLKMSLESKEEGKYQEVPCTVWESDKTQPKEDQKVSSFPAGDHKAASHRQDNMSKTKNKYEGAQWFSGKVLASRPRGRGFELHWRHCVVSLSKNINPILVLVQPMKTRPFITERLLMGRKESNQTNKQI